MATNFQQAQTIAEAPERFPLSDRAAAFSFLHRENARAWKGERTAEYGAKCRALAAKIWLHAGARP